MVKTIKRQTRATYGCMAQAKVLDVGLCLQPRLNAGPVYDDTTADAAYAVIMALLNEHYLFPLHNTPYTGDLIVTYIHVHQFFHFVWSHVEHQAQ